MKKIVLFIFIILLVGCTSKEQKVLESNYYSFIESTEKCVYDSEEVPPFDTTITLEVLNDNTLIYRMYLDNPKEDIYNIEAMIIHNKKTEDIFPSSGLYEEKLNLVMDQKNKGYIKGIILNGYIDYTGDINEVGTDFKVLVRYQDKFKINYEYCYYRHF